MKAVFTLTIAIFGRLILVAETSAQQRRGGGPDVFSFLAEKYDMNFDGKLSREEYDRSEENFKRFDTNKDGVLTPDDWSGGTRGKRRRGDGRQGHGGSAAPKVGDPAPDFSLTHINDETKTVQKTWKESSSLRHLHARSTCDRQ